MQEIFQELIHNLKHGETVAMATIVKRKGSVPREVGAKMLVHREGKISGTVGGGCGEAEVRIKALEVLETGRAEVVQVDLTNPLDGDDKICGGIMDVFVERIG